MPSTHIRVDSETLRLAKALANGRRLGEVVRDALELLAKANRRRELWAATGKAEIERVAELTREIDGTARNDGKAFHEAAATFEAVPSDEARRALMDAANAYLGKAGR